MMNCARLLVLGLLVTSEAFGQGSSATDPTFYSIVFGVANFAALPDCTGTTGSPPRNKTQHRYVIDEGHSLYQCRDDGGTFAWTKISELGDTAQDHFETEVTLSSIGAQVSIVANAAMTNEPMFRLCPPGGCDPAPPLVNFLADGKVGIGTASPVFQLDLISGGTSTSLARFRAGGISGAPGTTIGATVGFATIFSSSGEGLSLGSNNQLGHLVITAGSDVGIGTTSPTAKLHLSCGVTGDCFKVDAFGVPNAFFVANGGKIGIGTGIPGQALHVQHTTDNIVATFESLDTTVGVQLIEPSQTWQILSSGGQLRILDLTNSSTVPFRIEPGSPTNTLYIESDGDIGIGISSPTEALDIDSDKIRLRQDCNPTPTASSDTGVIGEFCFGSDDRIYRHNGTDWVRSAVMTTF